MAPYINSIAPSGFSIPTTKSLLGSAATLGAKTRLPSAAPIVGPRCDIDVKLDPNESQGEDGVYKKNGEGPVPTGVGMEQNVAGDPKHLVAPTPKAKHGQLTTSKSVPISRRHEESKTVDFGTLTTLLRRTHTVSSLPTIQARQIDENAIPSDTVAPSDPAVSEEEDVLRQPLRAGKAFSGAQPPYPAGNKTVSGIMSSGSGVALPASTAGAVSPSIDNGFSPPPSMDNDLPAEEDYASGQDLSGVNLEETDVSSSGDSNGASISSAEEIADDPSNAADSAARVKRDPLFGFKKGSKTTSAVGSSASAKPKKGLKDYLSDTKNLYETYQQGKKGKSSTSGAHSTGHAQPAASPHASAGSHSGAPGVHQTGHAAQHTASPHGSAHGSLGGHNGVHGGGQTGSSGAHGGGDGETSASPAPGDETSGSSDVNGMAEDPYDGTSSNEQDGTSASTESQGSSDTGLANDPYDDQTTADSAGLDTTEDFASEAGGNASPGGLQGSNDDTLAASNDPSLVEKRDPRRKPKKLRHGAKPTKTSPGKAHHTKSHAATPAGASKPHQAGELLDAAKSQTSLLPTEVHSALKPSLGSSSTTDAVGCVSKRAANPPGSNKQSGNDAEICELSEQVDDLDLGEPAHQAKPIASKPKSDVYQMGGDKTKDFAYSKGEGKQSKETASEAKDSSQGQKGTQ